MRGVILVERVRRLDLNPKRGETEHTMELLKAKSFLSVLLTVTFLQCEMGPVHIYTQKLLFSGVTCWWMELEIGWLRNCVAFEMVMG